jgi:hypothetical protein
VLPGDLSELRECVRSVQARLVVIDPIVAAIDVSFDAHKDQHVRSVLAEIAALAEQEDLAVAMVGHLNKAPSSEAYIRVANSVAFWNASRSVVLVTEDPDEPESHRLIAQRKANCSRLAPIQRHRIEEIVLPDTVDHLTGEQIETSRMVFIEYADDVDGDDLLGPRSRGGKEDRAVEFLAEALADDDWHDSVGLKKLAGATGISERTVQRASQDLEVEHDRRGFPSSTWWRLPQSRQGLSHTDGASGSSIEIPANKHIGGEDIASHAKYFGEGTTGTTGLAGPVDPPDENVPGLGDAGFTQLLQERLRAGHITEREMVERLRLHEVVRAEVVRAASANRSPSSSTRRPSWPSLASRAPLLRRSCELCLSSSSTGCARYTSAARLRRIKSRHDTTGPGSMPRV